MVWLPVFGFFMRTKMLLYTNAHEGCTNTIRESALKADSERKVPCCSGKGGGGEPT